MAVEIRPIKPTDNESVARIIRAVMPEFAAHGPGFAIHDREVDTMFETFTLPRSQYVVCILDGKVIGGGGVAPLLGGDRNICELKKMYFLPDGRGLGLGQKVLSVCLEEARKIGYVYCYLETFNTMTKAMELYERNGFKKIPGPLGSTGHFACDTFYQVTL